MRWFAVKLIICTKVVFFFFFFLANNFGIELNKFMVENRLWTLTKTKIEKKKKMEIYSIFKF